MLIKIGIFSIRYYFFQVYQNIYILKGIFYLREFKNSILFSTHIYAVNHIENGHPRAFFSMKKLRFKILDGFVSIVNRMSHPPNIIQCFCRRRSARTRITIKRSAASFGTIIPLFYSCSAHTLIPKVLLHHFNSFIARFSELKTKFDANSLILFSVIFNNHKIRPTQKLLCKQRHAAHELYVRQMSASNG